MKIRLLLILTVLLFASCNDDAEQRNIENAKAMKKREAVFNNINRAWNFNTRPVNPTAQSLAQSWEPWRIFLNELSNKPKSSIGAFRAKARTMAMEVADLNKNIPVQFNKPEIRSRIAVLATKVNSLYLFISLNDIPDEKVVALISEINTELMSLQMQMGEITRKSQIPKEEGEADMIRMRDTSRAIPNELKLKPAEIEQGRRFP
ncbi:MAG TPA: hypothetical protein VGB50_12980 [Flavobacterium sp.]